MKITWIDKKQKKHEIDLTQASDVEIGGFLICEEPKGLRIISKENKIKISPAFSNCVYLSEDI